MLTGLGGVGEKGLQEVVSGSVEEDKKTAAVKNKQWKDNKWKEERHFSICTVSVANAPGRHPTHLGVEERFLAVNCKRWTMREEDYHVVKVV